MAFAHLHKKNPSLNSFQSNLKILYPLILKKLVGNVLSNLDSETENLKYLDYLFSKSKLVHKGDVYVTNNCIVCVFYSFLFDFLMLFKKF